MLNKPLPLLVDGLVGVSGTGELGGLSSFAEGIMLSTGAIRVGFARSGADGGCDCTGFNGNAGSLKSDSLDSIRPGGSAGVALGDEEGISLVELKREMGVEMGDGLCRWMPSASRLMSAA